MDLAIYAGRQSALTELPKDIASTYRDNSSSDVVRMWAKPRSGLRLPHRIRLMKYALSLSVSICLCSHVQALPRKMLIRGTSPDQGSCVTIVVASYWKPKLGRMDTTQVYVLCSPLRFYLPRRPKERKSLRDNLYYAEQSLHCYQKPI
jgi:hypothetical protein